MANIPNLLFARTQSEYSILLNLILIMKLLQKYVGNIFLRCHVRSIMDHLFAMGKSIFSPPPLISGIHYCLLYHVFLCSDEVSTSAR